MYSPCTIVRKDRILYIYVYIIYFS